MTISHLYIVICTTLWLTAYLLRPGFWEAHVCQGVQGRQVLSVDLGWGWIFSRWQQCGHIAALHWFLVCWVNGLGLELTYWGLGLFCVRPSHGDHCLTLFSCVCLSLILRKCVPGSRRGERVTREWSRPRARWERERADHWSPVSHKTQCPSQLVRVPEIIHHNTQSSFETFLIVLSWAQSSTIAP